MTETLTPERKYDERDYIDRTIATIRQHNRNHLRENWWTGAALALADEVDRVRAAASSARTKEEEGNAH